MDATHLHLMLNHIPVLGTAFGLGLLVFALWRKSEEVKMAALGFFLITALFSVPVYLTGGDADPWIPLDAFHRLHADLTGAGARVRTDLFPGRPHEVGAAERAQFRLLLARMTAKLPRGHDALG